VKLSTSALVLVLVLFLGAGVADAATLSLDASNDCYRAGDTLTLSGTGFTPGGAVDFTLDGEDLGSLTADSLGSISAPLQIGNLRGVGARTLEAIDETNPVFTATTQFLGSALQVTIAPRNGDAGRKLRVKASGFTTGSRLYAHVRRGSYRRDVFIGALRGRCGTLSVRRAVMPGSAPNGKYTVQFDTHRHYSRATHVWYRFTVTVGAPKPKPKPKPKPQPQPQPQPPTDCQGYSPCLPPGGDVDCAGGSGDGPRYVQGPVYVTGSDPYDLDRDGDGVACES
jgi:hypothetical protein